MAEQASAWVTLIPSARGFGRKTESALVGELGGVGERQGKHLGGKMSGAFGSILKKGTIAAAGGAGALIGTALFKGFTRLNAIDQAEAKLSGLGHSAASVDKIMDNALASVKGTAFGLDEAATTAAGAVAAGIKPGQQLQKTLSLVADAATIGGTSMGEMGAIFNKVAATGKIQGEVIAQLGERGIPILQLLGKQLGKTPAEVSELASQGKIDFETFSKAMESGLGGAALKSGKTFSGAFKNMGAALGRLGASLLKGVFPKLGPAFGKITTALDKAGPFAERLGKGLGDAFSKVGQVIGPVADKLRGMFSGENSGKLATFVGQLRGVFDSIKSIVMDAVSIVQSLWARFGGTIITLTKTAFTAIWNVIRGAFTVIQGIFRTVAALLKGDWSGVWDGLKLVVSGFWTVIKGIVSLGWAVIKAVFKAAGTAIKAIFVGIWNGIKTAAASAWPGIKSVFAKGAKSVGDAFKSVYDGAKKWLDKAWSYIKSIPGKIKSAFSSVWTGVANGLKSAINSVLHLPLKIPKIDLPVIGSIGGQTLIHALAAGGVVTKPTLALIGEAGPEAVVPLSGSHGKRAAAAGWHGDGDGITRADLEWHVRQLAYLMGLSTNAAINDQLAFAGTMSRMGR